MQLSLRNKEHGKGYSSMSARKRSQAIWGLIFIFPTIAGLLLLNYYPIVQIVYQSFCKTGDFGIGNIFIGLDNYTRLFKDEEIYRCLWNSIRYSLFSIPLTLVIPLILAVFLNQKIKLRGFYRTVFFLPMVCAPAAVAMVWKWMYNQDYGLLNHILGRNISWVTDPKIAMISVVVVGVWSALGYNMILFLGGLQEIPKDYYEAAQIDGCTGKSAFIHITIPLLSPMLFFVLQTGLIGSLQLFDLPFMIMDKSSRAWPSVKTITYLFYEYAFEQSERGYGAAIVMFTMAVIGIFTIILQKSEKKWVFYE